MHGIDEDSEGGEETIGCCIDDESSDLCGGDWNLEEVNKDEGVMGIVHPWLNIN